MIPSTARVVHLKAPKQLVLQDDPLPSLGMGELLCETIVSAISPGTELGAYNGLPPLRAGVIYPRLQGYCNVARVIARSDDAEEYEIGDRILTFQSHRSHFVTAIDEVLLKLPEEADAQKIACTYLFHLGYNAVLRSNVRAGSRVLVLGLGVLGLTSVAMASLAGADVIALSNHAKPAERALEFGARAVFNRGDKDELAQAFDGKGADIVITTTNGWADWAIAMEMASEKGTIASLGFPGRGEAPGNFNPLDSQYFYSKQLRIESVGLSPEQNDSRGFLRYNERDNIAFIASLINTKRLSSDVLISGVYESSDIQTAYDNLNNHHNSPVTYLLNWAS